MKRALPLLIGLITIGTGQAEADAHDGVNYYPDGRDIVCLDGHNRFTRALYGGPTDFRLETSDVPIFATYGGAPVKYNITFEINVDGQWMRVDSAETCETRYRAGLRSYKLRDRRWGGGELTINALASYDDDAALWKISWQGMRERPEVRVVVRKTAVQKMPRGGDIGAFEKPGAYEPAAGPPEIEKHIRCRGSSPEEPALPQEPAPRYDIYVSFTPSAVGTDQKAIETGCKERFDEAERQRSLRAGTIEINTPDPWLNTLGGNIVMAADGAWDGQTWLHGAVGWRNPLPGWRGTYMGDFLGMPERQRSHFRAYAMSQVMDVPVSKGHLMDQDNNLARGAYEWGTPMYSDGYICRQPGNNRKFHHYDMNLIYIDELLWHLQFDADSAFMREMWPVLESHLKWEKQAWDADGDHLYDAYCCIWASDALQYSGGAVSHSSAYNYRANLLASRIAEIIGEDPEPYTKEAEAILKAMNERLWVSGTDDGHPAEYQDLLGNQLLHPEAALWSIYTPIDCGTLTAQQAWQAMTYVDRAIPRIPFTIEDEEYYTISTSNWQPYEWSINNVAMAEVMHIALAYYQAGRPETATRLLKANILDFMYAGRSPGNFGQLSQHDRVTGEGYRDFADVVGISSRAILEGLFGITPQALYGECIIRPGLPESWQEASVRTPYLSYEYKRVGEKDVYKIRQNFSGRPLRIILRQNLGQGRYIDIEGTDQKEQTIEVDHVAISESQAQPRPQKVAQGTALDNIKPDRCYAEDLTPYFNSSITDIFQNEYLSPRSPYTTLCLPKQGIGDWCSTKRMANISDEALRQAGGVISIVGIPFKTPAEGPNVAYASKWDNYPDTISLPLEGRAERAYLLMTGSTNPMQSQIVNGEVRIWYYDGTSAELELRNPDNWCPIEQDYQDDGLAFNLPKPRPWRIELKSGRVSRTLVEDETTGIAGQFTDQPQDKKPVMTIDGGAAQLLEIGLDPDKQLKSVEVIALTGDVVIGLAALTLQR